VLGTAVGAGRALKPGDETITSKQPGKLLQNSRMKIILIYRID